MEKITKVGEYVVNGTFDVACSIRPDKDSTEKKTVTLRFRMNSVPLQDVVTKALSSAKIQWQNGPGRSKFDLWKDKGVVEVDFKSPAAKVKTREEYIEEYKSAFMRAGLDEKKAEELATKAVDNPEVTA